MKSLVYRGNNEGPLFVEIDILTPYVNYINAISFFKTVKCEEQ